MSVYGCEVGRSKRSGFVVLVDLPNLRRVRAVVALTSHENVVEIVFVEFRRVHSDTNFADDPQRVRTHFHDLEPIFISVFVIISVADRHIDMIVVCQHAGRVRADCGLEIHSERSGVDA